jgi:hypothetical protein
VQRGYDGHIALLFYRLAGENGADRVRDGVMNVKQVQFFGTGDGRHLGREGEVVWLVLEQGVRHHFHLVKVDALIQLGQPRRQKRRDKVYIMSPLSQIAAELGHNDAAAAIGRINCNADVHRSNSSKRVWYHAAFYETTWNAGILPAKTL